MWRSPGGGLKTSPATGSSSASFLRTLLPLCQPPLGISGAGATPPHTMSITDLMLGTAHSYCAGRLRSTTEMRGWIPPREAACTVQSPCGSHQHECRVRTWCDQVSAVPCRAAFSFVYGSSAQPGGGGPLGVLTGLLGGSRTRTAAELPATDMRALDSLEDTLRKAGVLNK